MACKVQVERLANVRQQALTTWRQGNMLCFSYDNCAYNRLSLGPSSLLRHTLPSCTDYDSADTYRDSLLVHLLVVSDL
jgi:hypothetical protein